MEENSAPKKTDYIYKIVITQIICVVLLLAVVAITKYIFKDTYKELKVWYETYICDDTTVSEIMEGLENEI